MPAFSGFLARMLHFLRFCRPAAPGRSLDDAIAERLRAGLDPCPDASRSQQALALVLKAAAEPGTERELSGEAAAIDAFILATSSLRTRAIEQTLKHPHARKTPVLVGAITTALVAGLCGTAVADALPAPLQRFTHSTFGAPAPAPGSPAPALTGPSHSGSGAPTLSVTTSRPVPNTGDTGKISGQGAIPATSGAKTPTAPTSAASSSAKGNNDRGSSAKSNNGNGKAKGRTKSNGNGNGNGKAKGTTKSNGNGNGKDKESN
jgi:hypothetical protein